MTETRLATLTEAAEITGLSVDALRQRIKRGRLASPTGATTAGCGCDWSRRT